MTTALTAALQEARRQRKPRRRQEEHAFQIQLMQFLELALPANAFLTALDHADASPAQRASRARRGVKDGISDILIIWQADRRRPLQTVVWLEIKAKRGRLSGDQEIFRDHVTAAGHFWGAPHTIEEAIPVLERAGIPLRKVRL